MRARNLKPGFFSNELLAECAPLARLLFQGLWCMADRDGWLEDRPKKIKAVCLPYDNCNVDDLLGQLASRGFIERTTNSHGRKLIQIPHFGKHQRPHHKEPSLNLNEPEKNQAEPEKGTYEPAPFALNPSSLNTESCIPLPSSEGEQEISKPERPKQDGPREGQTWEAFLTVEWIFYYAGTAPAMRDHQALDKFFADLTKTVNPERALIRIRDPSRKKREPTWEFEKFFAKNGAKTSSIADRLTAAMERKKCLTTNSKNGQHSTPPASE